MFVFWIILIVWIINLFISYWNARITGLTWIDAKKMGGFTRFMTWMGAIMSASGFTWCYMIVLFIGGYYGQYLFLQPDDHGTIHPWITQSNLEFGFALGYLILAPSILFSGLFIWIESLIEAWKRRDVASAGIAGWNTFAQVHNTYNAMRDIPDALSKVSKGLFDNEDKNGAAIVGSLLLLSVISGVVTTCYIIRKFARKSTQIAVA